jgi:hypothetical protein
VAFPELALVAAGLAAGVVLDRLAGRLRPVPTAERQAHRPSAEPARQRPLAGPAVVRLRVARRRLRARAADILPRPQAGAAATVLVLAAMLILEAWTHAQPHVVTDPEPARTPEVSP